MHGFINTNMIQCFIEQQQINPGWYLNTYSKVTSFFIFKDFDDFSQLAPLTLLKRKKTPPGCDEFLSEAQNYSKFQALKKTA